MGVSHVQCGAGSEGELLVAAENFVEFMNHKLPNSPVRALIF